MLNIEEIVIALCDDLSVDSRDKEYILLRFREEGVSFLTKTLPAFTKTLLVGLNKGVLPQCTAFTEKFGLPVFLRGYLKNIFTKSRRLKHDADPVSIYAIRQLCDYFYKLSLEFSKKEISAAEAKFLALDAGIPASIEYDKFSGLRAWITNEFKSLGTNLHEILKNYPFRFGPGTFSLAGVSDIPRNSRYYRVKQSDLALHAPEVLRPLAGHLKFYPSAPVKVQVRKNQDMYSELLFVPKDSRGPRTIVREPFHNIRPQMCFHDFCRDALEKDTNYRINFIDQSKNRELAQKGSIDGSLSTIDLKDASDSISFALVKYLFSGFPAVSFFLKNFRTKKLQLPSGSRLTLNKLAGMGSGFTFPLMAALIYSTICFKAKAAGVDLRSSVYVYGDDIIVPTRYVPIALSALDDVFLHVNEAKSFTTVRPAEKNFVVRSVFRESCGGDYFGGNDVTPIRLKLANAKVSVKGCFITFGNKDNGLLQIERHCRELQKAGLNNLSELYYKNLEINLGALPYVTETSPALGRLKYSVDEAVDCFGNFIDVEAFIPLPQTEKAPEFSPYAYLAGSLRKPGRIQVPIAQYYAELTPRNALGTVSIPRKVVLVKKTVPQSVLSL